MNQSINQSINNINNNNNNSDCNGTRTHNHDMIKTYNQITNNFNSNNSSLHNYGNNTLIFFKKNLRLKSIKQQLWDLAVLILWLPKKGNLERHFPGFL